MKSGGKMDRDKLTNFIENSFLNELIKNSNVTDISYNGEDIYYVDNNLGRIKSDINIGQNEVSDFIRQIANMSENQFSYVSPYLDMSVDKYRINAVHKSIGRINNEPATTFSIRIASNDIKIKDDGDFFTEPIFALLKILIKSKVSIVIGGITSSGKTELQKYLFTKMEKNTRVVAIDNVQELEHIRNDSLDLSCWQVDEKNKNASMSLLIKNALRNNPDWLIVAESRGKEMIDTLNSAMTGLPIITTLHAENIKTIPNRIISMVLMNDINISYENVKRDVINHFSFFVYVKKVVLDDGSIFRHVDSVMELEPNGRMNVIFQYKNNEEMYRKISKYGLEKLKYDKNDISFITTFIGDIDE